MNRDIEVVIGIDPGSTGGLAVVDREFNLREACEMITDPEDCCDWLRWNSTPIETIAYVEKAMIMSGLEGKTGMQNYMRDYGKLLGRMEAFGIDYEEIATQTWKSRYKLIERRDPDAPKPVGKKAIAKDKAERRTRAKRKAAGIVRTLFPNEELYTEKGRLMDGKVEAILIAVFGMEREVKHTISETEWQGELAL